MKPEITICTCWDGRDYYPREYVEILHRMVERHTSVPHDFVLYIGPDAEAPGKCDGLDPAIRIVPVGMPSWWLVTKFWQPDPPGIRTKSLLYLDLDIVIIGSLDDLISFPSEHALSHEYPTGHIPVGEEVQAMHAGNANIGITLIRNNAGAKVWEEYLKAGAPTWDPLSKCSRGSLPLAGQTIINSPKYGIKKDLFPSDWICSYKYQVLKRGIPKDCRIVHFHGLPKQAACMHEEFVKEHWR